METTFDSVFDLGSDTMIAGGDKIYVFTCIDGNGAAVDLTGATVSAKLSPYGFADVVTLNKSGTITDAVGGIFRINLLSTDTKDLYGVYILQPRIIAFDTTQYQPGELVINIIELIQ